MTRQVSDIHELIELIDLEGIAKHEERARVVRVSSENAESEVRQVNSLGLERRFPEGFSLRLRTVVGFEDAEYVSDIAGLYSFSEPAEASADVLQEFIERVGFFALYPFLRESVFSSATRLGRTPPLMGLIKAGELSLSGEMSEAEVQREFFDNRSEID
ncbi:hypothetical protein [Leucobacter sp.]